MASRKRRTEIKENLDEASDDVMGLVINWRKDVRRRQVLGKMPKNMPHDAWVQDFFNYVRSRENVTCS